jgi:solute carrier family 25 aspartate/glutamate transporter 12/13
MVSTPTPSLHALPKLGSVAVRRPIAPTPSAPVAIPLHMKLAVGGMAGVIGVSATFPIDIVKTHLQGQTRSSGKLFFNGPLHCVRHILATDGVRGLYRGLPPTLVGVLPEKAIKLAVNEHLREVLANEDGKLPLSRQVLAAAGAGVAQVIATNPVSLSPTHAHDWDGSLMCVVCCAQQTEIVKIRLQTQASLPVAQQQSALQVVRSLGPRGLYKGAGVCLMRDIPYAVVFFPLYATLKDDVFTSAATGEASLAGILTAGAISGATAAGLVTPADVLKTRQQMRGATYTSTVDCFRKIVASNGYGALMKGAVPRMLVQAPLFGVTLTAFELQKKYMQSL